MAGRIGFPRIFEVLAHFDIEFEFPISNFGLELTDDFPLI